VNSPSHYNFGDIEVVDFIDQVTKHYNSDVAYHIGNAIKYIIRAPHKNGKEDVAKAKWSIERAFVNWDVKELKAEQLLRIHSEVVDNKLLELAYKYFKVFLRASKTSYKEEVVISRYAKAVS